MLSQVHRQYRAYVGDVLAHPLSKSMLFLSIFRVILATFGSIDQEILYPTMFSFHNDPWLVDQDTYWPHS